MTKSTNERSGQNLIWLNDNSILKVLVEFISETERKWIIVNAISGGCFYWFIELR